MTTGTPGARTQPVIAIDGPGGAGKSTVARELARRLGWRYLDSGAMYRAVTIAVLDAGVGQDPAAITATAAAAVVTLSTDPDDPWTALGGLRVTERIRGRDVTNAVSAVSAVPSVRAQLVISMRALVGDGGIVVEGRDIGTTVVPDADVKIFLTAAAAARAARRHQESGADHGTDLTVIHAEISRRDASDSSRTESPLAMAEDALEIDATDMSVDEVVAVVLQRCEAFAPGGLTRAEAGA